MLAVAAPVKAETTAQTALAPVTVNNFIRAETDLYMGNMISNAGGIGKLFHNRELASVDNQIIVRMNRDTLYSGGVFDLDAGTVTITLPDAGKRFMSMQVINEDHYTLKVIYRPGSVTLARGIIGTRYVAVAIRMLVDPSDRKDVAQVHALQDAVKVSLVDPGAFGVPNWDPVSEKKIRDALLVLASTMSGFESAFGNKQSVNPLHHLIGTAAGWGGNPDKDATYYSYTPAKNDGATIYRLNVKNVPLDGFWSVTVYNAQGYFEKNPYGTYSLNNVTAKKSVDGSVAVQFGGCDGKIANCLPIMKGWNYTVRLYRPRPEILSGKWKFPDIQPAADDLVGQK
jgi:hypothetical protein